LSAYFFSFGVWKFGKNELVHALIIHTNKRNQKGIEETL